MNIYLRETVREEEREGEGRGGKRIKEIFCLKYFSFGPKSVKN